MYDYSMWIYTRGIIIQHKLLYISTFTNVFKNVIVPEVIVFNIFRVLERENSSVLERENSSADFLCVIKDVNRNVLKCRQLVFE